MKYVKELSASANRATPVALGAAFALTYFYGAMLCRKDNCFTSDHPMIETLQAGGQMILSSALVVISSGLTLATMQAAQMGRGMFSKQPEPTNPGVPMSLVEQAAMPPLKMEENFSSPSDKDSVQANASEAHPSPHRSPSPDHRAPSP